MQIEPEKFIIDIIKHELHLKDSYGTDKNGELIPCIAIGSQNVKLGTTDKLQVIVRSAYTKVLANRSYEEGFGLGVKERKQAIYYDTMQIDFMSKNDDARVRRFELVQCLKSFYAKNMCDKHAFRIFDIPEALMNTGVIAGGSAINRWTLRFKVSYMREYTNEFDYYNQFKFTIEDEKELYEEINIKPEQKEES